MKIVLLAPHLGFQGGLERHVFDLAAGLRARGHAVSLAYQVAAGQERDRYASAFDRAEPIASADALLRGADVVYAHKVTREDALGRAPRRTPLTVMVHDHDATCVRGSRVLHPGGEACHRPPGLACVAHGCIVTRDRGARVPLTIRSPFRLARQTAALATRVKLVAGSAYLRLTLVDAGVAPERVQVIHPVPPEERAPLAPLPRERVVAFVGQLVRGKGLDLLLRAVAALPDVQLVVAGDGNARPAAEALARALGVSRRVDFVGVSAPERVREIYDRARVVAVPSRWPEPFGMVGVEAMRRARAVVGAWHGGIPEWLSHGETGYGFRPGDAGDLRETLRFALDEAPLEEIGQAALARATTRFSFARMVDEVERVILGGVTQIAGSNRDEVGLSPDER
jgi:glycosyltransferase involved in cell wall biosynthesis